MVTCGLADAEDASIACPHQCERRHLAAHEETCEFRAIECERCDARISARRARDHARVCPKRAERCDGCGVESDALGKCRGSGCHAILVACASCAAAGVYCCAACRAQDDDAAAAVAAAADGCGNKKRQRRKPCDCDGYAARERRLLPRAPTTEDTT